MGWSCRGVCVPIEVLTSLVMHGPTRSDPCISSRCDETAARSDMITPTSNRIFPASVAHAADTDRRSRRTHPKRVTSTCTRAASMTSSISGGRYNTRTSCMGTSACIKLLRQSVISRTLAVMCAVARIFVVSLVGFEQFSLDRCRPWPLDCDTCRGGDC